MRVDDSFPRYAIKCVAVAMPTRRGILRLATWTTPCHRLTIESVPVFLPSFPLSVCLDGAGAVLLHGLFSICSFARIDVGVRVTTGCFLPPLRVTDLVYAG